MKKHSVFLVLLLGAFSIHAEGIQLTCTPYEPSCSNCPEYQTLFPIEEFSKEAGSLNIEADESEMLSNQTYHLTGNVEVKSDELFLTADKVDISPLTNTTVAKGNVKFQDSSYLITSNDLTASRKDNELIAYATNANYQDFGAGQGGANGFAESIEKQPTAVFLTNTTYSTCPINKSDWLIDANSIELNLDKNRGVADHAKVIFYGVPILYLPKYSWVLQGRGSGFLTPDYDNYNEDLQEERSFRLRVPYYLNLAPDRDLLVALTYMSSRGLIYEGKYRQLVAPKLSNKHKDSIFELEARLLHEDKIAKLKRWLLDTTLELDISKEINVDARYYRVSDLNYFADIARTNTNVDSLTSYVDLNFNFPKKNASAALYTEELQLVNDGAESYTRELEGSVTKTFNATNKVPIGVTLVSTNFVHRSPGKESGVRTHGNIEASTTLIEDFPVLKTRANVAHTNYRLTSNNIDRTIAGAGFDLSFPFVSKSRLFDSEIIHKLTPQISYNYRAKELQGSIPIFDTEDKYSDIITFGELTSGERYTGLDRITNANDITLSIVSSNRNTNATENEKDLLSVMVAQSYYTDNEVVSDSAETNFEARKSYSDIVASIDVAIKNFIFSSAVQFNPDTSLIVKRENSISYTSAPRKFASITYSDDGTTRTGKVYATYPLNSTLHVFGGLDRSITKLTSTGVINQYTSGLAYENCCWAFRVAHFQDDKLEGDSSYNYSTGFELILKGLGSTSTPLRGRIEANIPGYELNLRK